MGAKLKSKTHLQNPFFDFLSRFLRIWLQSLQKVQKWPKKLFFIKKDIKKRRISRWFRIRWKCCKKMHQKKVTSKTSLTNISKSEKVHISVTFLRITFLGEFFKTFSTDSKSAWNSAFFDTQIEFFNKIFFLLLLALFWYTLMANAQETAQKNGKSFLWMCLRILLGSRQRVRITKLLKSLYPNP